VTAAATSAATLLPHRPVAVTQTQSVTVDVDEDDPPGSDIEQLTILCSPPNKPSSSSIMVDCEAFSNTTLPI
jgi:hypothetical protein